MILPGSLSCGVSLREPEQGGGAGCGQVAGDADPPGMQERGGRPCGDGGAKDGDEYGSAEYRADLPGHLEDGTSGSARSRRQPDGCQAGDGRDGESAAEAGDHPAGQGDAEHAASTAVQMLDQATGMESRRIHERIIAVRDAIGAMSDGRASAELAERIADMTGMHLHAR